MWLLDMFSTCSSGIEARISSTFNRDSLNDPAKTWIELWWSLIFTEEGKMDLWILKEIV